MRSWEESRRGRRCRGVRFCVGVSVIDVEGIEEVEVDGAGAGAGAGRKSERKKVQGHVRLSISKAGFVPGEDASVAI